MNIAVITGASSGMGRQFVLQLGQWLKVDEIWVIARRKDRLEELSKTISVPTRAVPMDLTDSSSFDRFSELLSNEKPNILLLVNAAGSGSFGKVLNTTVLDDTRMIDLNAKALTLMTRICLPYMVKGSNIINLGSGSSYQPVPYILTYGATKAYVLSYSRGLNVELKPQGIRVMCVTPMWVKSEFFDTAFKTDDGEVKNFDHFYTSEEVVQKAYKDCFRTKKDVSVCGAKPRMQYFLVKHLPVKWVMKTWIRQQKKKKNVPVSGKCK